MGVDAFYSSFDLGDDFMSYNMACFCLASKTHEWATYRTGVADDFVTCSVFCRADGIFRLKSRRELQRFV